MRGVGEEIALDTGGEMWYKGDMDAVDVVSQDELAAGACGEFPRRGARHGECAGCPARLEVLRLRWEVAHYKRLHRCACEREEARREENEVLKAKLRMRERELFGRKSERNPVGRAGRVCVEGAKGGSGRRGHRRGTRGHGRRSYAHLPVVEEWVELPQGQCRCEVCGRPFEVIGGSEDSEQVEVSVGAYRRRYRRRRYRPTCRCAHLPGVVVAPPPPKLIAKGVYGISVWVSVLLDKYAFLRPLGRLVADLATHGLVLSPGTVTDGLRRLAPLFEPLVEGLVARNLAEKQWHADETGWRVFEAVEGKEGSSWWLWVFRSASAVVFVLDPSRSARVPEAHLGGAEEGVLIVDRYVVYKGLSVVKVGKVLLAFCWQHVRRDFLDVARDWPGERDWGLGWVQKIGELMHLNRLRLEVLDTHAAFAPRDATLRSAVEAMAAARDEELAQAHLHPARRRALESLRVHWEGLTRFVDRPWIPMDNSEAERQLRGPAVGRKTFYGSVARWAGHLAAALFSLFATLRVWKLNPRLWLTAYLEACARNGGKAPPDAASFLPWNLSAARRREFAGLPPPDT